MSERLEQLAAHLVACAPDTLIGWRDGAALDAGRFRARMWAWCALLRGQPGRHFALYLDDSLEFGAALLGAWQAGKTIWLSADTLETSCAALRASVDGLLGDFPAACQPLRPAADGAAVAAFPSAPHMLAADFAALVVFTSGSTGAAQAIPKKLSQLASEVATLQQLFGAAADGCAVLATVSHQHIYGLLFKVLWPLCAGRPVHALGINFPEQLAAALAERPCVLVSSPAHLKRLPDHLDWRDAARQLRAVFSSGGPLPPETAQASAALLGRAPLEVYGSSETGGIAWRQRANDQGNDGELSWLAFPGVEWRLAAHDNLLEVRSAHLADEYWLTLADRVALADDGRFLLQGRGDRIVKIEEKRVSLDQIEAALRASPLVAEARVLLCEATPGARQQLAAFVVPTPAGHALLAADGKAALNAALRRALGGAVVAVALPRRWRYLDQLPLNAQGKTTHAALLALLESEPAPQLASGSDANPAPRLPLVRELALQLEQEPPRVLLELTAPAALLYFKGHFDQAPILPGVVQVDWALALGRRYFDLPPHFGALHALKFQHVIGPEQPVQLELQHDRHKGSLNFRYLSAAGQHSSGRILLRAGTSHV